MGSPLRGRLCAVSAAAVVAGSLLANPSAAATSQPGPLVSAIKATKDRRTGTIFKSLVPGDTGDVEEMFGDVGASQLMAK